MLRQQNRSACSPLSEQHRKGPRWKPPLPRTWITALLTRFAATDGGTCTVANSQFIEVLNGNNFVRCCPSAFPRRLCIPELVDEAQNFAGTWRVSTNTDVNTAMNISTRRWRYVRTVLNSRHILRRTGETAKCLSC